jgi:hypothetical protein
LAVCLATTVDALSVVGNFQPWSEAGQGVGYDPVLPSAAPRPVELTPPDDQPVPEKIAEYEPHEETPGPLWPADAVNIQSQPPDVNPLRRYEHLIVGAGRWLGQQHQAVHAMGQAQIHRAATGLAQMMPPADQADTRLATDTSTRSDESALPADPATDVRTDSWPSQQTKPLLSDVPVFIAGEQPELAWATDTRKVRVRPRPATAVRLSITAGGVEKNVEGVLNNSPYLPVHANPADRQAAEERTDTSRR